MGMALMKFNPPHLIDWSTVRRMRRLGLVPGMPFDFAKAPPAVRAGLKRAEADGLQRVKIQD